MKVEMNGVTTLSIRTWLVIWLLNSSEENSSGDLTFPSEAKRPAIISCFELMPAESIFENLYNRGGMSLVPVDQIFGSLCSGCFRKSVSQLFWLLGIIVITSGSLAIENTPSIWHQRHLSSTHIRELTTGSSWSEDSVISEVADVVSHWVLVSISIASSSSDSNSTISDSGALWPAESGVCSP